jgi:ABC-2 type transport system permease protein
VPGIVAYGVVTTTFSNLAVSLASAREQGLLKRIKSTPLPWWAFFAGPRRKRDLRHRRDGGEHARARPRAVRRPDPRSHAAGLRGGRRLGSAAFTALGIGIVRWLPSADSAGPMQAAIVFPLAFISGVWFPMHDAPGWLDHVSPDAAAATAGRRLQTAFDPNTTGSGFAGGDLVSLALWTVGRRLAHDQVPAVRCARD